MNRIKAFFRLSLKNKFLEDVSSNIKKPYKCPYHCISTCDIEKSPYCIALALMNAKKGDMDNGFAFAGENAYRAKSIISVNDLIEDIEKEYAQAVFSDNSLSVDFNLREIGTK